MSAPASCAIVLAANAGAQTASTSSGHAWPARPIRLIVPFPPGGATDANARALAKEVESLLGQSLVIDNRGGANGIIGAEIVARAVPDGYTLLHTSVAFAINPSTHKKLPFSVSRHFAPITNPVVGQGSLLAVNPSVPAHSRWTPAGMPGSHPRKPPTRSSPGFAARYTKRFSCPSCASFIWCPATNPRRIRQPGFSKVFKPTSNAGASSCGWPKSCLNDTRHVFHASRRRAPGPKRGAVDQHSRGVRGAHREGLAARSCAGNAPIRSPAKGASATS